MDIKEIKELLTPEDITDLLISLGSKTPRIINGALIFSSICHSSESYKLYYYTDTKIFHCYSNCGQVGDIFTLVQKLLDCTFSKAYSHICNFFNIDVGFGRYGFQEEKLDHSFIDMFRQEGFTPVKLHNYNESVLSDFKSNMFHHSWIDEGINIKTMKVFGVRFDIENYRIIIPHYDINNNLVGIRARHLKEEDLAAKRKYMPIRHKNITYSYPTGANLYGIHLNKETIKKYKTVILVEGEKSVMKHYQWYNGKSVALAVSGSNLTEQQVELIKSLGVERVILALDKEYENEEQEIEYMKIIDEKFISKLSAYFTVGVIWDKENILKLKESPLDAGLKVFKGMYEKLYLIK